MSTNDETKINPAWKEILDSVPQALHGVLIPALKKWDAGVTERFNQINAEIAPLKAYKDLADNNIDPEYAKQAVMFADRLQSHPREVVDRINQTANLGYVTPEDAVKLGSQGSGDSDPDSDLFGDGIPDITKHPQFQALTKGIETLQQQIESQKSEAEQQRQIDEFEEYLDTLETETKAKNLPFNRRYVTALMTQGLDGEAAVAEYHKELAIQTVDPNAPGSTSAESNTSDDPLVVMGEEGTAGGGTPDGGINFGQLAKNDFNSTVEQLLEQQLSSGQ